MTFKKIECRNVRKSFGGIRALDNFSLKLQGSQIAAVIGPNGAGKSTLFNVLTGFQRPDGGECYLGRCEVSRLAPYSIARLGVARTFQDLRLISRISVLENVLLACPHRRSERLLFSVFELRSKRENHLNRGRALEALELFGLTPILHEFAGALSYGERKLLAIACCIASGADIMLLDEPITGVHQTMVGKLCGIFKHLKEQGKLLMVIEHDLETVHKLADEVIAMDRGQLVAQGPPSEILVDTRVVKAFFG